MREQNFARLLVIILPTCLVLTWISKFLSSDSLRRDAMAELYDISDRAAVLESQSQRKVIQYVSSSVSSAACSDFERRLLFRAGASMGGESFVLRSGWGEVADCCEWKGVGCDDSGAVRSLSLPKYGLKGTLPTELGMISRLSSIDVNEKCVLLPPPMNALISLLICQRFAISTQCCTSVESRAQPAIERHSAGHSFF